MAGASRSIGGGSVSQSEQRWCARRGSNGSGITARSCRSDSQRQRAGAKKPHATMRFLHLVRPVMGLLPEVVMPDRKIPCTRRRVRNDNAAARGGN